MFRLERSRSTVQDRQLAEERNGLAVEAPQKYANQVDARTASMDMLMDSASNSNQDSRILGFSSVDFSKIDEVEKIGGNAEGAYRISDQSGSIVVKIAESIDSTVMAHNLSKDFGINTPEGRLLSLNSPAGKILQEKANELNPELATKMENASSVTLWSLVNGQTLEKLQINTEDESIENFTQDPVNFKTLGRMLVFDVAILNEDRFKVIFNVEANMGNLMISDSKPIAIDQDFAKIDPKIFPDDVIRPGEQLEDHKEKFLEKIKEGDFFSNANEMANVLCNKMANEGYFMFLGKETNVEDGIREGIDILRGLLDNNSTRLEDMIKFVKERFHEGTDLNVENIRSYWKGLLSDE